MPIRDEFIERAVRQLAAAFATLVAGRHGAMVEEAEAAAVRAELDDIYRRFIGTSASLIARLSTEDLLGVLGSAGYVDGERAYLLSALLETEAELEVASGAAPDDEGPTTLRGKALDLALEAGIEELGEPDLPQRVKRLLAEVPAPSRSPATWERMVWFWQAQGEFARSEDALFAWLEQLEGGADGGDRLRRTADRFYEDAERLDEEALEKGNLPRDELAESRAELAARLASL